MRVPRQVPSEYRALNLLNPKPGEQTMAVPHAEPAEVIDVSPLGASLADTQTTTLINTDSLEVIRLVLPAGKDIAPHQVPGEITVQCLEGKVVLRAGGADRELVPGNLLYLAGSTEHAVHAVEDSSLLLTILLERKRA
jgi:quercetin dioxygenase-like cupin family protein